MLEYLCRSIAWSPFNNVAHLSNEKIGIDNVVKHSKPWMFKAAGRTTTACKKSFPQSFLNDVSSNFTACGCTLCWKKSKNWTTMASPGKLGDPGSVLKPRGGRGPRRTPEDGSDRWQLTFDQLVAKLNKVQFWTRMLGDIITIDWQMCHTKWGLINCSWSFNLLG